MNNNLKKILDGIFSKLHVYFYTIDNNNEKIVIFTGTKILEVSLKSYGEYYAKSNFFYFYLRELGDLDAIYTFINGERSTTGNVDLIIKNIIKYEDIIRNIFIQENDLFYNRAFSKISINKKILFIIKGGGLQEIIESAFVSYCYNSNLNLTILYRFGMQWGKKLDYSGFFNELRNKYGNFQFIYNEDFDDDYIDSIIDKDTEIFSLGYDYRGKYRNIHLIASASVSEEGIHGKYKNIFSCFKSESIGYSSNIFLHTERVPVYNFFNPQNIVLLNSVSVLKNIDDFILAGGMSWSRDFSILDQLEGGYKGVLISDKTHDINNFFSVEQIRSYYGFLGVFILSKFFIHTPRKEFSCDDRHKMLATSICSGRPVVVPHNDGLIVKEILNNKLGVVYESGNNEDFIEKVCFFAENRENIEEYSKNCKEYAEKNMDVNKFMNFIFDKAFNSQ